jgi:hypothetical protein
MNAECSEKLKGKRPRENEFGERADQARTRFSVFPLHDIDQRVSDYGTHANIPRPLVVENYSPLSACVLIDVERNPDLGPWRFETGRVRVYGINHHTTMS